MESIPIIGLIGRKRSGKDTTATRLVEAHGFERVAFADALKAAAYDVNPLIADDGLRLADLVDSVGWEAAKSFTEVRRFLQELGVSMRRHVNTHIWVDVVRDRLVRARYTGERVVVTDVRFPNETSLIEEFGGVVVKIERPGLPTDDAASQHISERALDDYLPAIILHNDSTIEALYRAVDEMMSAMPYLDWDEIPHNFRASDFTGLDAAA